jgi:argininosuccinate synthase
VKSTFVTPRDLERLTSELGVKYADLVYKGLWYSGTRQAIDALVSHVQQRVTGVIRMRFFKGDCVVVGRQSPFGDVRAAAAGDLAFPPRQA